MTCVTAALGSCLFLYWGKSQAMMTDREIGRAMRAAQEAHTRVAALRAEWALLNQPDRLSDMAGHYLKLQPVAPAQFAETATLAGRLPPPGAAVDDPGQALASDDPPAPEPATMPVAAPKAAVALAADLPKQVQLDDPPPAPEATGAPARRAPDHRLARGAAEPRYLTPMMAEARQPMRVRDSGEALLNGEPEPVHLHAAIHAAAYAALPPLPRAGQSRVLHRPPAPAMGLPQWLTQAHVIRLRRSEPPHMLSVPLGTAIPLAAPRPEPAAVQRVIARPAPEPEPAAAPPIREARPQEYEPPRPAYRPNYAYGAPYRPYYPPYGYGGYQYGYRGGYGNPYDRGYPPPGPNAYYQ